MPAKSFTLKNIGVVTVSKRRGAKRLNLRVSGDKIMVSQPVWLPYAVGVQFALSHNKWIDDQRSKQPYFEIKDGLNIGKTRVLRIASDNNLRTRIGEDAVTIFIPPHLNTKSPDVLRVAVQAIKRALKSESTNLLPSRLEALASKYDFTYRTVSCKSMKTRWGSCTNDKKITLNIFLMMVPWELIDYVLLHELAHTKHLHHGKAFWDSIEAIMPDYKERRKKLKNLQSAIAPLY